VIKRPATILALLTALNFLNYIDRYVLSAVLPKVQESLSLSDKVSGFLGTIFLLGYFVTSPIFGTLADRGGRRGLIAFGIFVWSLATVGSGFAQSAGSLIAARALVGVGEASYATIAPTIIDDIAPADKRTRWLAIFYAATPIGSAIGFLVGGFIEVHYDWRMAFFVAGGPGIILAFLCLAIKEPERQLHDAKPSVAESFKVLSKVPLYVQGVLGYCAATFAVGGFAFWAPTYIYRRFALPLDKANFFFGLLTVAGGALGTFVGGSMGDRMAKKRVAALGPNATDEEKDRAYVVANLWVCFISSAWAAPFAIACFLAPTPAIFFAAIFACEAGLFLSTSPVNAVVLRSVPPGLRAGAMALSIFGIHLLGDLWSPPLVGSIADTLKERFAASMPEKAAVAQASQIAMMILPVALAVSAALWFRKSKAGTPG
jgi:MFS family permease